MLLKPKKSLGQHFLRSEGALNKIVEAADLKKSDLVLEVGPGEGVLTEKLLEKAGCVIAIEKDKRSVEILKSRFSKELLNKSLILHEEDILEVELPRTEYKVVANVPYYISGAIIRLFLEVELPPQCMTLLLQKEVVERIIARDKKESILSISVKAYGKPRMVGIVKAGSFFPPPKVDSAIIKITNISKETFELNKIKENKFFDVLHAGFAHKRKLVANNLKQEGFLLPLSIDQKSRAEDLEIKDWIEITKENQG